LNYFPVGLLATVCTVLLCLYWIGGRANRVDWGTGWLNRLEGINRLFCRYLHHVQGPPLILPEGGLLLACNHSSGLDPLLLLALSNRPLRFLIAREEYQRWWLRWLLDTVGCIPIDRNGRPEKALSRVRLALNAGEVVVIFPQGGIQQPGKPLRPMKRGVALLACVTSYPVLPVRIRGVRGAGLTLGALILPGRPNIKAGTLLYCQNNNQQQLMTQITDFLQDADRE